MPINKQSNENGVVSGKALIGKIQEKAYFSGTTMGYRKSNTAQGRGFFGQEIVKCERNERKKINQLRMLKILPTESPAYLRFISFSGPSTCWNLLTAEGIECLDIRNNQHSKILFIAQRKLSEIYRKLQHVVLPISDNEREFSLNKCI